jgi:hypothetical protein
MSTKPHTDEKTSAAFGAHKSDLDTPSEHWVYVAREMLTGAVKIGRSSSERGCANRIKSLQTGCPYEIETIAVIHPANHPGETELHKRLDRFRIRTNGEWFFGCDELFNILQLSVPAERCDHSKTLSDWVDTRLSEIRRQEQKVTTEWELLKARVEKEDRERSAWESTTRAQLQDELRRQVLLESIDLDKISLDEIKALCERAMWTTYYGVEFRRWLLLEASFGTVHSFQPYFCKDLYSQTVSVLAYQDEAFLEDLSSILRAAKRSARTRVAA